MHLDDILQFCNTLKATEETFPFDQRTLVFKVMGKMYALVDVEEPDGINLKCDPEEAIELRERYPEITAGYHMSKKHWNTVYLHGNLSDQHVKEMIVKSYELVVASLTKKLKDELKSR